jgi:hypothetical protein
MAFTAEMVSTAETAPQVMMLPNIRVEPTGRLAAMAVMAPLEPTAGLVEMGGMSLSIQESAIRMYFPFSAYVTTVVLAGPEECMVAEDEGVPVAAGDPRAFGPSIIPNVFRKAGRSMTATATQRLNTIKKTSKKVDRGTTPVACLAPMD